MRFLDMFRPINDYTWWKKAKPMIDEQVLDHHEDFSKHCVILPKDLINPLCLAHDTYAIDYMYEKGWKLVAANEKNYYFEKVKK